MEKKPFFEQKQFDDVAYAQDVFDVATKKLEKQKFALIVSVIATISWMLVFTVFYTPDTEFKSFMYDALSMVGFFGALISYVLGGGFKLALSTALKIAALGWIIMPFPINLFTGCVALIFSFAGFFCIPVVFVLLNFIQLKKDKEEAENYLKFCK